MARVVLIGAGFAGQTAALYIGSALGKGHEITVINANEHFYFIPSFVWVGTGRMAPEKTRFPLQPVYDRFNIRFLHARATAINPQSRFVLAESRSEPGVTHRVDYDFLVVATGPRLNFEATPGLGPHEGHSASICTCDHAVRARDAYLETVRRMQSGSVQRLVIGTGHPGATCQGAALEYISNIHKDLVARGLRDRAELHWISNEPALGDFGIRGISIPVGRERRTSEDFISAIFGEMGISWEVRRGVLGVEPGRIHWEDTEAARGEAAFDFAMLIPQFTGQPPRVFGDDDEDLGGKLLNPAGFIKVDAQCGSSSST